MGPIFHLGTNERWNKWDFTNATIMMCLYCEVEKGKNEVLRNLLGIRKKRNNYC